MASLQDNDDLLKKIAIAIVENPRSTIKELAEASGISNATLHRFCGTRENLENILLQRAEMAIEFILSTVEKEYDDYALGLKDLIKAHCNEHEFLQALFALQSSCSKEKFFPYFKAMDDFFLRGQKQGTFRIDINVSFLTTIFYSSVYGLINAERQGRIAKMGMEDSFVDFFLSGITQPNRRTFKENNSNE